MLNYINKCSANANRNAQQVHVWNAVKQSLSHSPDGARRLAVKVSIVFYLLVLARDRLYHSANVVSAGYSNFCLPPSHLTPSFGVTPLEFTEKLYGSWNYSLPGSRQWKFGNSSLHRFWLIHPCDRWTDGQNCDG